MSELSEFFAKRVVEAVRRAKAGQAPRDDSERIIFEIIGKNHQSESATSQPTPSEQHAATAPKPQPQPTQPKLTPGIPDLSNRARYEPPLGSTAQGHAQAAEGAAMARRAWDYSQRSGMGVPGNVPNPNNAPAGYYQGGRASNRPQIGPGGRPVPPTKPPGW